MTAPSIDPNWILAVLGGLTLLGTLIGFVIKIIVKIDTNVSATKLVMTQISETQKVQWTRIDEQGVKLDEHGDRIKDLEAWKKYHEKEDSKDDQS